MNEEAIQERIDKLIVERDQHLQTAAAIEGAITDCKYWLALLRKKPEGPL